MTLSTDPASRLLADMVADIPGITRPRAELGMAGTTRLRFLGWSPMLCAVNVSIHVIEKDGAFISDGLETLLATQRERAREARELHGHETPKAIGAVHPLDGLQVDSDLLALVGKEDFVTRACQLLRQFHETNHVHDGGSIMSSKLGHLVEIPSGDPTQPASRFVGIRHELGPDASFDGARVEVRHGPMPEAVLTAAAGRPLRDLVDLPGMMPAHMREAIGTRTATSARNFGPPEEPIGIRIDIPARTSITM